jgi:LPXTG-motif cell wall-anchored protein
MRRVASFLLVAGLVVGTAPRAHAAPTSNDPKTAASDAAAWLVSQVTSGGFIPSSTTPGEADLSATAQAVPALAAAGVGKSTVTAMLGYLGTHVEALVSTGGSDSPGSLANLILAAEAAGLDPTAFGTPATNLVQRLLATQQPGGLFGASVPKFDGAFREGLSLLALSAAGVSNAAGVAWLEAQQCDDGLWTAFRKNTTAACPPVNPANFTGPDTNSTAYAVLGLVAQGDANPADAGVAALLKVRTADHGWGFLASSTQSTDANSTGLVMEAIRTDRGAPDGPGGVALLKLQAGCDADAADRGGIAFQPGSDGTLAPNTLATVQAIPALAGVALPIVNATIADAVPTPCAPPTTTTVTVAAQGSSSTTTTSLASSAGSDPSANELPRTGSSSAPLGLIAFVVAATGLALVGAARRQRER